MFCGYPQHVQEVRRRHPRLHLQRVQGIEKDSHVVCPGSVCWGWVESRRRTSCNLGHNHGLDVVDDDDGVVGGHDDVVGDDNEVPYGIHQNDDKNVEGK